MDDGRGSEHRENYHLQLSTLLVFERTLGDKYVWKERNSALSSLHT
jgi:hypothetical protein